MHPNVTSLVALQEKPGHHRTAWQLKRYKKHQLHVTTSKSLAVIFCLCTTPYCTYFVMSSSSISPCPPCVWTTVRTQYKLSATELQLNHKHLMCTSFRFQTGWFSLLCTSSVSQIVWRWDQRWVSQETAVRSSTAGWWRDGQKSNMSIRINNGTIHIFDN